MSSYKIYRLAYEYFNKNFVSRPQYLVSGGSFSLVQLRELQFADRDGNVAKVETMIVFNWSNSLKTKIMLKLIPYCKSTPSAFEGSVFVRYFTTAQLCANRVVISSKGAFDMICFLDEYLNSDVFHFF